MPLRLLHDDLLKPNLRQCVQECFTSTGAVCGSGKYWVQPVSETTYYRPDKPFFEAAIIRYGRSRPGVLFCSLLVPPPWPRKHSVLFAATRVYEKKNMGGLRKRRLRGGTLADDVWFQAKQQSTRLPARLLEHKRRCCDEDERLQCVKATRTLTWGKAPRYPAVGEYNVRRS